MEKQEIIIQNPGTGRGERSFMRISLPGYPWGEVEWTPRRETAPRGSHMFTSAPGPYERFVAALREVAA